MNVINLNKIGDLITDELYNEYCGIEFMYDGMKNKNVKVKEQIKSYISSKNIYDAKSTISKDEIKCDINDDDEEDGFEHDNASPNECIQYDQLWSYLLNIKPTQHQI
jgi:hypothetical protein